MMSKESFKKLFLCPPLWERIKSSFWPFSHFTIKRNLSQFTFSEKMCPSEHEALLEILKQTLMSHFPKDETFFFKTKDLLAREKEAISTRFFMQDPFSSKHETQAFVLNPSHQIYAEFDKEDHLMLGCFETASHWNVALTKLFELEKVIEQELPFSFTPQFGYLTADPAGCGTAFNIQIYLHLPCLIHLNQVDKISEKSRDENLIIRGLSHFDSFVGDLVIIENQYTLGLSEQHILEALHKTATKLSYLEEREREKLKKNPSPFLIDKIGRALGTVLHAYRMDIHETLNTLSLFKLGAHLNLIKGITDRELNEIFFYHGRSYFSSKFKKVMSFDDLLIERASYLKKRCKKIELKIS